MAWRFVKQPNGLLARFSDIVDNFTHYNLTEAEAIEVACEYMSQTDAKIKVQAGLDDINPWTKEKGDGLSRWNKSCDTIKLIHGEAELQNILNEIEGT